MKKILLTISIATVLLHTVKVANSQAPGSVTTYGGSTPTVSIDAGGTVADGAETIYIGPGTYTINGTWEIYSKNVVIDPAAVITGTGSLVFYNPSVAGGMASATLIDGNASNNAIDVNIKNDNASGIVLTNINFPADLTAAGFTNNSAASTLYVGNDINLDVDGANITLGTGAVGDLRLTSDATISNYSSSRMVITNNSVLSHMVKDAYTGSFTFPVGIASGDYTPAVINNTVSNAMHVGVVNYSGSTPNVVAGLANSGVQRIWNIYADNATGNSTISLQHNTSTDQQAFLDASNFVTQYNNTIPNTSGDATSTDGWQNNSPGAGTNGDAAGSSVNSRVYTTFATAAADAGANFTKRTAVQNSTLPVTLLNFVANTHDCVVKLTWATSDEINFSRFELQSSTDNGLSYSTIATIQAKGVNSNYNYTDNIAVQGINLYRLKMVDIDNKFTYSYTVTATVNCSVKPIVLYPNPTTGSVSVNGLKGGETVQLYNMKGQLLIQQRTANTQQQLNLSGFANGVYTVIVSKGATQLLVTKIIKQQ